MNQTAVISAAILAVLGILYMKNNRNEVKYVVANDGRRYLVQNAPDSKAAANLLAEARGRLVKLCDYLRQNNGDEERVQRMLRRFNPDILAENGRNSKYTAYSVNKGEKIMLCLRSRDAHEQLIDINTLMFVALHELGHVMTKSQQHTDEFWTNFKYLLKCAVSTGIYHNVDYSQNPQEYCSITINENPLNDPNIGTEGEGSSEA